MSGSSRILNVDVLEETAKLEDGIQLSKKLQSIMLQIKSQFIKDNGKVINYQLLAGSDIMKEYISMTGCLRRIDASTLGDSERKAFFINVYNALTIHGVIDSQQPTSVLNVQHFWKTTCYQIGKHVFSLDDIEHGVLRGNRPHPSSTERPFLEDDERQRYVVQADPRIHFALNCGAKSCPAIQVYTAHNLETALVAATKSFCADIRVEAKHRRVWLSKIFQWYQADFGDDYVQVMRWLIPFVEETVRYGLIELLDISPDDGPVDVIYTDYNWKLNKL